MGRFRLLKPILGVDPITRQGRILPPGTVVEVPAAPPAGNRTVDVVCDGKPTIVFVNDLFSRSEKVNAT